MNKKYLPYVAGLLLVSYTSKAQITVDNSAPYDVPETLINDVFLGGGVTATNIEYTGGTNQIGYYEFGLTNGITFSNGLLMCTGAIQKVEIGGAPGFGGGISGDADLLSVAQSVPGLIGETFTVTTVNDIAVLEFDFVPAGDYVEFNYAFASNEWNNYINTQYNDVFGFFISGPGISGPYENDAVNIAYVPETDPQIPITISSITPTLNEEYYVSNSPGTGGVQQGYSLQSSTVPMQATMDVTPGETYHIKLAIGDGTDTALDSAVFFGGGSFKSGSSAFHVVEGGSGLMDGTSMDNAASSIEDVFQLELEPETVIVWEGNYQQTNDLTIPEEMSFWVKNGAIIDMGANDLVNHGEILIDQNSSIEQGVGSDIIGDGNFVVYRSSTSSPDHKNLLSSPVVGADMNDTYEVSDIISLDASNVGSEWGDEASGTLNTGEAYMVSGSSLSGFDGVRIYEGTLNNGNYTINLDGEDHNDVDDHMDYDGWNAVGNPYVSKLSIADLLAENPYIGTIGLYYSATNKHIVFNRLNGIASHKIASGQGFYVYTPESTDLYLNNAMRVSGAGTIYRSASSVASQLRLELENEAGKNYNTELHFTEVATNNWDALYDAPLMPNAYEIMIYSLYEDQPHAIQAWGAYESDQIIPLGVNGASGSYSIDMNTFSGFPEDIEVVLEDLQTGTMFDMESGVYSFTKDEDGANHNRFVLHIGTDQSVVGVEEILEDLISVQQHGNQLLLSGLEEMTLHHVSLYRIDGKEIASWSSPQVINGQFTLRMEQHTTGYYLLHLETGAGTIVHKLHLSN